MGIKEVFFILPLIFSFTLFFGISNAPSQQVWMIAADFRVSTGKLDESSGLCWSYTNPGHLWSINDNKDKRLFAIKTNGVKTAVVKLKGGKGKNWEDLGAFSREGTNFLFIADVGLTGARRVKRALYILPEPVLQVYSDDIRIEREIEFKFDDGSEDCEAVVYDNQGGRFILIAKNQKKKKASVFSLDMNGPGSEKTRFLLEIPLKSVTGADISPNGLNMIILSGDSVYQYSRNEGQSWEDALSGKPLKIVELPNAQWEGICYAGSAESLFVSSEQKPARLLLCRKAVTMVLPVK